MEKLNKKKVIELIDKASRYYADDQVEEAKAIFTVLASEQYDDTEVLLKLGGLAQTMGEKIAAIDYFARLNDKHPDNALYACSLGRALNRAGLTTQGEQKLREAVALNPSLPAANMYLGDFLRSKNNFAEAAELLEKAVELKPSLPKPYPALVDALKYVDRHEDALEYAKKLVSMEPSALSYNVLARTLIEMGQQEEAVKYLKKAIKADRTFGPTYHELSTIKKYSNDDRQTIRDMEAVLEKNLPLLDRAFVCFALGKIYNDCGEWDKAFKHYREANTLVRGPTEPHASRDYFRILKKALTKKIFMQGLAGSGSETPVFIVGMPRSGTTLLEQIISSHPEAEGAGELAEIGYRSKLLIPAENAPVKELQANLNSDMLREQAEGYLAVLRHSKEHAGRVVDKMPDNFLQLGIIHLLFPNATIIHAVRNPLDTCLSCYFQPFRHVQMSFSMEWIANHYRFYRQVMDHWKRMLPSGRIVEVRYEDVIEHSEREIRRIIEACGLPWNPVCLDFQNTRRAIKTASLWQARQSLYSTSKKRWLNYASHIEELVNGIQEYLEGDDLDALAERGIRLRGGWPRTMLGKLRGR